MLAIEPKLNLVNQFVLDSMHLLYLGLMLRLFENWMDGEKKNEIKCKSKERIRSQDKHVEKRYSKGIQ